MYIYLLLSIFCVRSLSAADNYTCEQYVSEKDVQEFKWEFTTQPVVCKRGSAWCIVRLISLNVTHHKQRLAIIQDCQGNTCYITEHTAHCIGLVKTTEHKPSPHLPISRRH